MRTVHFKTKQFFFLLLSKFSNFPENCCRIYWDLQKDDERPDCGLNPKLPKLKTAHFIGSDR